MKSTIFSHAVTALVSAFVGAAVAFYLSTTLLLGKRVATAADPERQRAIGGLIRCQTGWSKAKSPKELESLTTAQIRELRAECQKLRPGDKSPPKN